MSEMSAQEYRELTSTLRKKLAAALGLPRVPDAVWGYLDRLDYPVDFVTAYPPKQWEGSHEWDELVDVARDRMKEAHSRTTGPGGASEEDLRVSADHAETVLDGAAVLDEYSKQRAETFSEVTAILASRRADVRAFRGEYLDEATLLPPGQADAWLRGAQSEPLTRLREVARRLSKAYRWRQKAAEWFVLTGDAPFVTPLNVQVRNTSATDHPSFLTASYALDNPGFSVNTAEITIVAEPWVDQKLVASAYRQTQRRMLSGKSGRSSRKSLRTLEAIRFAARHIRDTGAVRWSEVKSEWNRAQDNPEHHYQSRGAISQAFKRFLEPQYNSPQFDFEPEPWQQREIAARRKERELLKEAYAKAVRAAPPLYFG